MEHRRPARAQIVHHLWDEQPGLYRGFVVDAATAVVLGFVLMVGGRQHTQATAWNVVNANGGPVTWGSILLAAGIALTLCGFGSPRLVTWMLWLLALLYTILGIAFFVAVWQDPDHGASYFGVVLILRAVIMHVSRAQAYREGAKRSWIE